MKKLISNSFAILAFVSLVGLTACPGSNVPKPSPSVSTNSAKAEKLLSDMAPKLANQKVTATIKTNDNQEIPVQINFSGDGKQSEAQITSETQPTRLILGGVEYTNFKEGNSSFGTKQTRKVWISSTQSVTVTLLNALSSPTISFTLQRSDGFTYTESVPATQALGFNLAVNFSSIATAVKEVLAEGGISGPSGSAG